MAIVVVDPTAWTSGSPIYYHLSVGNAAYSVYNAGSGYTFDKNATYALTSPDDNKLRFEVRSGDNNWYDKGSGSERSEIGSREKILHDTPLDLSYKFSVEPGAVNTAKWLLLGQLHVVGEDVVGGRSPEMSIELRGETLQIVIRYLDASGKPVAKTVFTDSAPIQRGHEYDMQIKAVFDPDGSDGRLVVVRDGQVIVDYSGQLGYADTAGVHWKEGVYRSPAPETMAATFSDLKISTGAMVEIPPKGAPYVPQAEAPTIKVTDGSVSDGTATVTIAGTAAAGSIVKIYDGQRVVAQVHASDDGTYSLRLEKLGAGTHLLTATSTDASGRLSKVSVEKAVEVGTAADILSQMNLISVKDGLDGIYLTDANTFKVSSLADMVKLIQTSQDALSKIDGGYDFEFHSGMSNNRTISRYNSEGVIFEKETDTYRNGVLIKQLIEHFGGDDPLTREISQFGITGQAYTSSYQGYDANGTAVISTRSFANGVMQYEAKTSPDGTVDAKTWSSDGKMTSSRVTQPDGTVTIEAYTAGNLTSKNVYLADGTTTTETFNTSGETTSLVVVNADKSSDAKYFTDGVLVRETIKYAVADASGVMRETFNYDVKNATYTTSQQKWSVEGKLLATIRSHADGTLDYTYTVAANGTTTTETYTSAGVIATQSFILSDKTTDSRVYTNGVLTRETIVLPTGGDPTKVKLVYEFNITGQAYASKLTTYNIYNKVSKTEYFTEPVVDTLLSSRLPTALTPPPTIDSWGVAADKVMMFSRAMGPTVESGTHGDASPDYTIGGKASVGATVSIYDKGVLIGTTTAKADGTFSFTVDNLGGGSHELTATATRVGGQPSVASAKIVVEVLTAEQFVANIAQLETKSDLASVILTDTTILPIPVGGLPAFLAKFGHALGAVEGEIVYKGWSGHADNRTLWTYDAAGVLQETANSLFQDGELVRQTIRHYENGSIVWREVDQYGIVGKSYTSSSQTYDAAGNLVASTRSYADGTLQYQQTLDLDGTETTQTFDAAGKLTMRTVTEPEGGYVTEKFNAAGTVVSKTIQDSHTPLETKTFEGDVLVSHTIKHEPGTAGPASETFTYGITGKSYVSTHTEFNAAGKVVAIERYAASGNLDSTYATTSDGSTVNKTYASDGTLLKTVVVNSAASGSPWAKEITNEVADGGPDHVSDHTVYNAKGQAQIVTVTAADGEKTVTLKAAGLTVTSTAADESFVSFKKDGFYFGSDFGNDTIENFHAGRTAFADVIKFASGVFLNNNPLAEAQQVGDDVVLTAINHDTITLTDLHLAQLNPFNFLVG